MKTKAIINGKRYDTKTAIEIASRWNGLDTRDFRYISEALYKTPRGEYFLTGEGGCHTEYVVKEGNASYGGERIITMNPSEARAWLERYKKFDELEAHFGDEIIDA